MQVSTDHFHQFARLVGLFLSAMGVGLIAVFAAYILAGVDLLGPPLELNGLSVIIFGSVGAFALPLGLSLFPRDGTTSVRLRVASGALALMALLRLAAFSSPEVRAVADVVPLVEFLVLGSIALLAYLVRPHAESPIELQTMVEIEAPADQAWHILAERFGDVASYTSLLRSSFLDGPVGVGAVRTCETPGFGPFPAAQLTETLTEYHPDAMRFTYVAGGDLPSFIPSTTNRWSVEAVGPSRCRVRSHASVDLRWWAIPFAPLLAWSIRTQVVRSIRELRQFVERGAEHPQLMPTAT